MKKLSDTTEMSIPSEQINEESQGPSLLNEVNYEENELVSD